MSQNGDNWKEAVNLSGLVIGGHFYSYPITRLSEEETQRAQSNAKKTLQRCSVKWCNNLLAANSANCAFHVATSESILHADFKKIHIKFKKHSVKPRRFAPVDTEAHEAVLNNIENQTKSLNKKLPLKPLSKESVKIEKNCKNENLEQIAQRFVERVNLLSFVPKNKENNEKKKATI